MYATTILSALSLIGATFAVPTAPKLQQRAVVAHDSLSPIASRVQTGANGEMIAKFAPRLHLASGCEVYTAVNDAGDTRYARSLSTICFASSFLAHQKRKKKMRD